MLDVSISKNRQERIKVNRAYSKLTEKLFNIKNNQIHNAIIEGDLRTLKTIIQANKKFLH